MSRAVLRGTDFVNSNLSNTNLSGLLMDDVFLLHAKIEGADLSGADWRGVQGGDVDFSVVLSLDGAIFRNSKLTEASFNGMVLKDVRFDGGNVRGADFREATLIEVVFEDADIEDAQFEDSSLEGVTFEGSFEDADFDDATFEDCDLTKVEHFLSADGLDDATWRGRNRCPNGDRARNCYRAMLGGQE